jgi:hypothetical protein
MHNCTGRDYPAAKSRLEEGADGKVDEQVGGGFTADDVGLPWPVGEVEESTDMVVIIEGGEQGARFVIGEAESRKSDGFTGLLREKIVTVNKFAKGQHGNSARSFSARESSGGSVALAATKGKRENWRGSRGFGKMLGGTELLTSRSEL